MKRLRILWITPLVILATAFLMQSQALAAPLPGAIWTTNAVGTQVDGNIYPGKCSVFLNGGGVSHHLPNGSYDIAVTDPSSALVLGKGSEVVTIDGGTGTFGPVSLCSLVSPSPYRDTTNPGGEYKVWLCVSGGLFDNSSCKTDNFKVRPAEMTPTPTETAVTPTSTPVPPTTTPTGVNTPTATATNTSIRTVQSATPTKTMVSATATVVSVSPSPTPTWTETKITVVVKFLPNTGTGDAVDDLGGGWSDSTTVLVVLSAALLLTIVGLAIVAWCFVRPN